MEISMTLIVLVLAIILIILVVWTLLRRASCASKHEEEHHKEHVEEHPRHVAHAENKKPKSQDRIEVRAQKRIDQPEFPRHAAKAEISLPVEESFNRVVEVESVNSLFTPKDSTLDELGMTPEELEEEYEKYQKKRAYKQRRLPVNKNFSIKDYKSARSNIRESIKVQQVGEKTSVDHKERQELIKKALSHRRKKNDSYVSVDVMASTTTNDALPSRRGGGAKLVRV